MKALAVVTTLIIGMSVLPAHSESPPANSIETFKYAFRISGTMETMRQEILSTQTNSQIGKSAVQAAINSYSIDEFADRVSDLIKIKTTEQEASSCISFIKSPAGIAFLNALESAKSQAEAELGLKKLPNSYQKPIQNFVSSSCYRKAAELLVSPDVLDAQHKYGVDLVCAQYKQLDESTYSNAVKSGYCKP